MPARKSRTERELRRIVKDGKKHAHDKKTHPPRTFLITHEGEAHHVSVRDFYYAQAKHGMPLRPHLPSGTKPSPPPRKRRIRQGR